PSIPHTHVHSHLPHNFSSFPPPTSSDINTLSLHDALPIYRPKHLLDDVAASLPAAATSGAFSHPVALERGEVAPRRVEGDAPPLEEHAERLECSPRLILVGAQV